MPFLDDAKPLIHAFAFPFSNPTYTRLLTLAAAAILTPRSADRRQPSPDPGFARPCHRTSYQRVLPSARRPGLRLGCTLTRFPPDHVVPDGTVELAGDDTADGHPGRQAYGKARPRDAPHSSHSYTARRYGRTWVVFAVPVTFPFASRRRALLVLVDVYRSQETNREESCRHKTPARRMARLLRVRLGRFPDRAFVFAGDFGSGGHAVAWSGLNYQV